MSKKDKYKDPYADKYDFGHLGEAIEDTKPSSWDGVSFEDYRGRFERENNVKGDARSTAMLDEAADGGPDVLTEPLERIGIGHTEAQYLARAAGLKNVNSKNDVQAMLDYKNKMEDISGFATKDELSSLRDEMAQQEQAPAAQAEPEEKKEPSAAMQEALERVRNYESGAALGGGEGVFRDTNEGVATEIADVASTNKSNPEYKGDTHNQKEQAGQNFLDKFKLDLKTNRKFA